MKKLTEVVGFISEIMKVEEIINQLKEVKLGCTISGKLHLGKILMLDLQTDKVLLKLESKINSTESIIVPNLFANSEDDYHFEEKEILIDEVWLNLK